VGVSLSGAKVLIAKESKRLLIARCNCKLLRTLLIYISLFLFLSALLLIFSQGTHFLRVLLVLEIITLSLFVITLSIVGIGGMVSTVGFGLIFLVFGVYEAANGLGLLVSRTRSRGIDQLSGLFTLNL